VLLGAHRFGGLLLKRLIRKPVNVIGSENSIVMFFKNCWGEYFVTFMTTTFVGEVADITMWMF